jgi:hypothetical protein
MVLTPAAQRLYDNHRENSKRIGAIMLADPFIVSMLPHLLEAGKNSKLFIEDNFSSNFCIGDYEDPKAIWFKTTYRNNKLLQDALESQGWEWNNLSILEYAAVTLHQTFVKRGNIVHFGQEQR